MTDTAVLDPPVLPKAIASSNIAATQELAEVLRVALYLPEVGAGLRLTVVDGTQGPDGSPEGVAGVVLDYVFHAHGVPLAVVLESFTDPKRPLVVPWHAITSAQAMPRRVRADRAGS